MKRLAKSTSNAFRWTDDTSDWDHIWRPSALLLYQDEKFRRASLVFGMSSLPGMLHERLHEMRKTCSRAIRSVRPVPRFRAETLEIDQDTYANLPGTSSTYDSLFRTLFAHNPRPSQPMVYGGPFSVSFSANDSWLVRWW